MWYRRIVKTEHYSKKTKAAVLVSGIILVAALGILDFSTGYEISFSIFYLLPIILTTWLLGRLPGLLISGISIVTWMLADLMSGHIYSHPAILFWNSLMRFGFFLIIVYFLTTIKQLLEHERNLARTDALTGVANSRYFLELSDIELKRTLRFKRPLSIAYMDIDNFKNINDKFGHQTGNDLLCVIAETIRKNIRAIDTVARFGGDEFVILMPETGRAQAHTVINKIQRCLAEEMQKRTWNVTFSIGVATCDSPNCSLDDLIRKADGLMYAAKNSGKNMAVFG